MRLKAGSSLAIKNRLKYAAEDWLNKERNFRCLEKTASTCMIDMRSALMLTVTTIYPATVSADAYRAQNIWNTHGIYYMRWVTVCNQPLRPTQPSTLSGAETEYWPKCGGALWLWIKGRYGSFHLWINVCMAAKSV